MISVIPLPRFVCILSICLFHSNINVHVQAIEHFSTNKVLQLQQQQQQQQQQKSDPTIDSFESLSTSDVKELYFEQRLDHFASHPHPSFSSESTSESGKDFTFKQRYFYSSRNVNADANANVAQSKINSKNHDDKSTSMLLRGKISNDGNQGGTTETTTTTTQTYAFLCVGGEGPSLTKHVLVNSVHCTGDMLELASKMTKELTNTNIHLFALEHRYYGQSYPTFKDGSSSVSNSNLVYLSSRQAISDIANFITFANDEYGLNGDNGNVKWITFGGSYPGMLAAWSRLKFPHLIYAAISNSAPVEVVLDFDEYNNVVAKSLRNPMVGGSEECLAVVRDGHEEISSILKKKNNSGEEEDAIAKLFHICGGGESLRVKRNVESFLGEGVVYIPAQENDPSCSGDLCNIEKICNFLTTPSSDTPMEKLAAMATSNMSNSNLNSNSNDQCTDISWENMISFLSSDEAKIDGTRSWLWQTCTEMGFYQTCNTNSSCPYGKGYYTLELDLEICERSFGIDANLVPQNVKDTLIYYGGWDMEGSRILSVNGDIDPWSALSMNKGDRGDSSSSSELPTYWSVGASHHFWTHEVKDSDGEGISKTREMIYDWVMNLDVDLAHTNSGFKKDSGLYTFTSRV